MTLTFSPRQVTDMMHTHAISKVSRATGKVKIIRQTDRCTGASDCFTITVNVVGNQHRNAAAFSLWKYLRVQN